MPSTLIIQTKDVQPNCMENILFHTWGSGIYAEKWYLKNSMSHIGLYASAPPPPRCCFYCPDKNMWKLWMQVGLHSEMRVFQTNGSKTWISFIWILSPQRFCICDCHCFTHLSLCCQSFIGIPMTYIQYNPANSNPLGEYGFNVKVNRVLSEVGQSTCK